jgi:hypothetical protein
MRRPLEEEIDSIGYYHDAKDINERLDEFVDINDEAVQKLAHLNDIVIDSVWHGSNYTPQDNIITLYEDLTHSIRWMIKYLASISRYEGKKDAETLTTRLQEFDEALKGPIEQLHYLLRFDYHKPKPEYFDFNLEYVHSLLKDPFKAIIPLLTGTSQKDPKLDRINTLEDMIRLIHAIAVDEFNQMVRWFCRGQEHKDHDTFVSGLDRMQKRKEQGVPYIGSVNFEDTPMEKVAESMRQYLEDGFWTKNSFEQIAFTERGFSSHGHIGAHIAYLSILYDRATDEYYIRWSLNEAGYDMQGRIKQLGAVFPLMDFKHRGGYNGQRATKRVKPKDLDEAIKFVLFINDNSRDLDMGRKLGDPKEFINKFRTVYAHNMIRQGRLPRSQFFNEHVYNEKLALRPTWTEREEQILYLLVADAFPIFTGEKLKYDDNHLRTKNHHKRRTSGYLDFRPQVAGFLAENIHEVFPEGASTKQVKELYIEALDVFYKCFEVHKGRTDYDSGDTIWERVLYPMSDEENVRLRRINQAFRAYFYEFVKEKTEDFEKGKSIAPDMIREGLLYASGIYLQHGWNVR